MPEVGIYAAVLAGGRSSRMGKDKRFLEHGGVRFVDRALRAAQDAAGGDRQRVYLCGDVPGYDCLRDRQPGLGPLGGVVSALREVLGVCGSESSWLLVMPVDMPSMGPALEALVCQVRAHRALDPAWAICFEGYEMPFALRVRPSTLDAAEDVFSLVDPSKRSLRELLRRGRVTRMGGGNLSADCFLNVNTPGEYMSLGNARAS